MIECQSMRHSTQGGTKYELPGSNIPGLVSHSEDSESGAPREHDACDLHTSWRTFGSFFIFVTGDDISAHRFSCAESLTLCTTALLYYGIGVDYYVFIFFDAVTRSDVCERVTPLRG